PFDAPTAQERVVRVERSATPAAVAVRLPLRKDFLVKLFRKEKLACNDLVAAEKHLEMDVRRAAAVPARIDGAKVDLPIRAGDLRAAQKRLPRDRRQRPPRARLPFVAGVKTDRVSVP